MRRSCRARQQHKGLLPTGAAFMSRAGVSDSAAHARSRATSSSWTRRPTMRTARARCSFCRCARRQSTPRCADGHTAHPYALHAVPSRDGMRRMATWTCRRSWRTRRACTSVHKVVARRSRCMRVAVDKACAAAANSKRENLLTFSRGAQRAARCACWHPRTHAPQTRTQRKRRSDDASSRSCIRFACPAPFILHGSRTHFRARAVLFVVLSAVRGGPLVPAVKVRPRQDYRKVCVRVCTSSRRQCAPGAHLQAQAALTVARAEST
jgi:hypothetical protein